MQPSYIPSDTFFDWRSSGVGRLTPKYWQKQWEKPSVGNRAPSGRTGTGARLPYTLSDRPYLAAPVPDVNFTFEVRPGGVRFRVSRPTFETKTDTVRNSVKRGQIREFSRKSRKRLGDLAADLGELYDSRHMVTLTYPGDWATVAPDGTSVKLHLEAFKKRLARYFGDLGVGRWSALWFLEFQKRGAPHFHLLTWGNDLRFVPLQPFQEWIKQAWAEVVGHPNAHQFELHRRRGAGVERMRTGHFGYALKYATKMEQKRVPDSFSNVGRFWGIWNSGRPAPAVFSEQVSIIHLEKICERLVTSSYTESFASRLRMLFDNFAAGGCEFSATVWGKNAVQTVCSPEFFP
jgi:hypothetical protein